LKQLLGRPVALIDHCVYGDHGFDRIVVERAVLPPSVTRDAARRALDLVEGASRPATAAGLGGALAKLLVKTARRNQGAVDAEATVSAYIEELLAYPADVALAALSQRRKWWPTWDELADDCERLVGPRREIHRALQQFLASPTSPSVTAPTLQPMPGSAKAAAARKPGHVSWSPRSGNVERLAKHLDITPSQARARIFEAAAEELADYEAVVRQLAAAEGQVETSVSEGNV
jgi:hypothetical protein